MRTFLCVLLLACVLCDYDWTKVEDAIEYYRANGAYVGGVLRVANRYETLYESAFGNIAHNGVPRGSPRFTNETIFDMASLTKVTATLTCIMHLVDQGRLGIDDLVTKYIPEYANNGKEPTIIRNLLLHNAGLLPDYPPPLPATKKQVMDWTYNCSLYYPIGTKFIYSDLSFILLGEISERITGFPLEINTKMHFLDMDMPNSTFTPIRNLIPRIAPTEYSRKSCLIQLKGKF
jgi:CubicO group peptidase (beta-lactamase class C family)